MDGWVWVDAWIPRSGQVWLGTAPTIGLAFPPAGGCSACLPAGSLPGPGRLAG